MTDKDDSVPGIGVGGSVNAGGSVVGRDQINVEQLIVQVYQGAPPLQLDDAALRALRAEYLAFVREWCQALDFRGIRISDAVEKAAGLSLNDVYVPVRARPELPSGETWQRIAGRYWRGDKAAAAGVLPEEAEPVALETVVKEHPALVVLGDPGAGKSTLMKRLALELAQEASGALPILAPLNAYGEALQQDGTLCLSDFLPRYYAGRQGKLAGLEPLFREALAQGKAVVLLDGLDEVIAGRERVASRVDDFVREHLPAPGEGVALNAGNRVIATSRFVGYKNAPVRDPRWHTMALVDWEREEIEQFVRRFTLAVEILVAGGDRQEARAKAARERDELLASVLGNHGIQRLAGNPLLLTILVLIKRQGVTLPDRRVELYELYLETLLRNWNKARALDGTPVGPEIDYHEV